MFHNLVFVLMMVMLVLHKLLNYFFILLNALPLINKCCSIVNDSNFKSLYVTRDMVCYTFFMR